MQTTNPENRVLAHRNSRKSFPSQQNADTDSFCSYWNKTKDMTFSNQTVTNNTSTQIILNETCSLKDPLKLSKNEGESASIIEPKETLSREELVARRRLKVAERRQLKKQEKKQLKQIVIGVQAAKPDFSLEEAAEDFPALNVTKKTKKTNKPFVTNVVNKAESNTEVKDTSSITAGKSWKPKVKDPICYDINQVLQHKTEVKPKPPTKKIPVTNNYHSISIGNILDSDNPLQNKGKVRPDKKWKPSKLKEKILLERNERWRKVEDDKNEDSLAEPENNINVEEGIYPLYTDFEDEIGTLLAKCAFIDTTSPPTDVKSLNEIKKSDTNSKPPSKIHSRKFREYCTNCVTDGIVTSVCSLLKKVAYFQDRTFAKDPIKANAKRRYVAGIHQTTKFLRVKKVKLLIIASDLEKNSIEGGLDEKINFLIKEAECQGVPCVFGPYRKRLGKSVFKTTLVSCVAVLSYEGAEEQFSKVMEELLEARMKYLALTDPKVAASDTQSSVQTVESPEEDVTASFLATLREEVSPAHKLLKAIQGSGS